MTETVIEFKKVTKIYKLYKNDKKRFASQPKCATVFTCNYSNQDDALVAESECPLYTLMIYT